MAKIDMFWNVCITCKQSLKTNKEKHTGHCHKCSLRKKLLDLDYQLEIESNMPNNPY